MVLILQHTELWDGVEKPSEFSSFDPFLQRCYLSCTDVEIARKVMPMVRFYKIYTAEEEKTRALRIFERDNL